jgi:hypothetical protein
VAGVVLAPEDLAPNWRGRTPVLCVSSRGPFDEAATQMLSQTLDRHGLNTQVVSLAALREGERPERVEEIAMVCFSYLEPVSLSQIRFTVRQARAALPGVRVLVGFWRERDPASLERLRRATSADYLVTSLNEALAAVMSASRTTDAVLARNARGPGRIGAPDAPAGERRDLGPALSA